MRPHPEGGWYVETWRAPAGPAGERPAASTILYLLAAGEASHWHRVDAAEVWQWSGGEAARAARSGPRATRPSTTIRLGGDVVAGEQPAGRGPSRRLAGRPTARRLDARRLHRGTGLLVRWLRAGAGRLGAAGRRHDRRPTLDPPLNRATLDRQGLLERDTGDVADGHRPARGPAGTARQPALHRALVAPRRPDHRRPPGRPRTALRRPRDGHARDAARRRLGRLRRLRRDHAPRGGSPCGRRRRAGRGFDLRRAPRARCWPTATSRGPSPRWRRTSTRSCPTTVLAESPAERRRATWRSGSPAPVADSSTSRRAGFWGRARHGRATSPPRPGSASAARRSTRTRRTTTAVVRYLGAYGPASLADIGQWLGPARIGDPARRRRAPRRPAAAAARRRRAGAAGSRRRVGAARGSCRPVRFLSRWDSVLISYDDRDRGSCRRPSRGRRQEERRLPADLPGRRIRGRPLVGRDDEGRGHAPARAVRTGRSR